MAKLGPRGPPDSAYGHLKSEASTSGRGSWVWGARRAEKPRRPEKEQTLNTGTGRRGPETAGPARPRPGGKQKEAGRSGRGHDGAEGKSSPGVVFQGRVAAGAAL